MKCLRCEGLLGSALLTEDIKFREVYREKLKCLVCGRFYEYTSGVLVKFSPPKEWDDE